MTTRFRRTALPLVGAVAALLGLVSSTYVLQGPVRDTTVDLVSTVLSAAAGSACLYAARRATGNSRQGWWAMAIACWAWAASQACWTLLVNILDIRLPYPSPVELGYLAFPIAAAVGLRRLTTQPSGLSTSRRVLDRLMVGSALVLVAWVAVLDTVVDNTTGVLIADALSLYYPVADVVLVTITVLTVAQLRHDRLRWGLLGAGVLLMALTDHVFAYELALGSYRGGTTFAWGWWLSFGLTGAAAVIPGRTQPEASPVVSTGWTLWSTLLPYVPPVVGVVLAGADLIIAVENDTTSEILLVTLILLVLGRQYVTLRDNVALTRTVRLREDQLHHQAFHDGLTGLANRALFLDRLGHALDLARRDDHPVSVAFLDLDGFKAVNDSLGHAAGDALLVRVAQRLRGSLRTADTLARLGGDEFAILIEHGDNPTAVAEALIEALRAPFCLDDRTVAVSASVGVATVHPDHEGAADAADLLHRADVAMYAVKTSGRGHVRVHSSSLEVGLRRDAPALQKSSATV